MARTKVTKLSMHSSPNGMHVIKMAARKSQPSKGGIKIPIVWRNLAARVGAFKRETIRMRMGKLNMYKIALLRKRNISRRKKEAKKHFLLTHPAIEDTTQSLSLTLETIDKLCLIF
jgi:hypothetical protein